MHMNAGAALLNLGTKGGHRDDIKFYFTHAMTALRFVMAEVRAGRGDPGLTEAMVQENIRALQKNAKYLKVGKIFKYATSTSSSKPDVEAVLRKLSPEDYVEIDGRGAATTARNVCGAEQGKRRGKWPGA